MKKEEASKVLTAKHANSTLMITQSEDVGRQFAVVKETTKTTTAVNLPHGYGLKGFMEVMFDTYKAKGELSLKLPARKAILDHICLSPQVFGKAMCPKITKKVLLLMV